MQSNNFLDLSAIVFTEANMNAMFGTAALRTTIDPYMYSPRTTRRANPSTSSKIEDKSKDEEPVKSWEQERAELNFLDALEELAELTSPGKNFADQTISIKCNTQIIFVNRLRLMLIGLDRWPDL